MDIKAALKQNKDFENPIQEAIVNIHFTSSWIKDNYNKLLVPVDVSMQQYNVLRILRGQHPQKVTVKYIIERMLDKSSNASRLVDKLLLKGLVERHQCPKDRRQVDVSISKKGLKLLSEVDELLIKESESINLTFEEAKTLSLLLDKMRG